MNNNYIIHAVIVKKVLPLEEALETFHNIINNKKKKYYRETKNIYRFRNHAKTKFIKDTFRTKKVNKNVSIVFGELLPEYTNLAEKETLKGSGIFDFLKKPIAFIKDVFKPTYKLNNVSTRTLNQYGNKPISSISVYRTPIMNIIDTFLNLLSFGKFDEAKNKYGYDKLFHLALVCIVDNKQIIVEKNEVINISTSYSVSDNTETMPIDLGNVKFTLNEMLERTKQSMTDTLFYQYSSTSNNCQDFLIAILSSNNLLNSTNQAFIKQNISELLKELPSYATKFSDFITDNFARISRLLGRSKKNITV